MKITEYTIEKIEDPFGIIEGDRFEFFLHIDVPEEDELYSEKGIKLRVLFAAEEAGSRMVKYEFFEDETNQYLDFELEEEEEAMVVAFCQEHLTIDEE
ncbi:DUF6509 family protein [Cytobacillus spongiae]|jgi:hypothetical protein|uniref:DUF6509 family protein n=1 Tax=Cytobacillus spongiae TaxID=2901381 RepID=UPI001F1899E1|nr:DUF6509 family protein [Cytobacillus spongiae]UII54404.1 DUF6509 family protein [Cytobacillus spongiae]